LGWQLGLRVRQGLGRKAGKFCLGRRIHLKGSVPQGARRFRDFVASISSQMGRLIGKQGRAERGQIPAKFNQWALAYSRASKPEALSIA
jgi:hypothetical protein